MLVGNEENEAGLEMTILGPKLLIKKTTLLAIGGVDMEPLLNGERIPLWRPILAEEGSMLCFGKVKNGCRAYVTLRVVYILRVHWEAKVRTYVCDWWYRRKNAEKGDCFQIGTYSEMANRFIQDLQKMSE